MKKVVVLILCVLCSITLVGCNEKEQKEDDAKREVVEKFNKISIGMTKEEINKILKVSDEEKGKYEDEKISVTFTDGKASYLELRLSYNREEIKNAKTDLSEYSKFTDRLDKGEEFYYQDLVDAFKTEGTCVTKNKNGCTKYEWADEEGRYMSATISQYSNGSVTMMMGRA